MTLEIPISTGSVALAFLVVAVVAFVLSCAVGDEWVDWSPPCPHLGFVLLAFLCLVVGATLGFVWWIGGGA